MTRLRAFIVILAGGAAGVAVGLGYLQTDTKCTGLVENYSACRINHGWIPFIGTVLAGILIAFFAYEIIGRLWLHLGKADDVRSASQVRASPIDAQLMGIQAEQPVPAPDRARVRRETAAERAVRIGGRGRPVPQPRRDLQRRSLLSR